MSIDQFDHSMEGVQMKVVDSVEHQDIGGELFTIEFEIPKDEILMRACEGNWACKNFMDRRDDFDYTFEPRCFYGKVGNLGYIVASDELIPLE